MARLGNQLNDVGRCPHCSIANPTLNRTWQSQHHLERATPGPTSLWAAFHCTSCGSAVLAKGTPNDQASNPVVVAIFPEPKVAHTDIPEPARRFLQQAYETMHAPDAAAVMAGSAVDAMLKILGLEKGTLYERIDQAVNEHKLTAGMGEWAHDVRLGSNRPRHADKEKPHVSEAEAQQSVEFADALGYFLFVLTRRIEKGKEAAVAATKAN